MFFQMPGMLARALWRLRLRYAGDPDTVLALLGDAPDPASACKALGRVGDAQVLRRAALAGNLPLAEAALARIDDQAILVDTAHNAALAPIRLQAMLKADARKTYKHASAHDPDWTVRKAALARLGDTDAAAAQEVAHGRGTGALLRQIVSLDSLLYIVGHAQDDTVRERAIDQINSLPAVLQYALLAQGLPFGRGAAIIAAVRKRPGAEHACILVLREAGIPDVQKRMLLGQIGSAEMLRRIAMDESLPITLRAIAQAKLDAPPFMRDLYDGPRWSTATVPDLIPAIHDSEFLALLAAAMPQAPVLNAIMDEALDDRPLASIVLSTCRRSLRAAAYARMEDRNNLKLLLAPDDPAQAVNFSTIEDINTARLPLLREHEWAQCACKRCGLERHTVEVRSGVSMPPEDAAAAGEYLNAWEEEVCTVCGKVISYTSRSIPAQP